MIGRGYQPQVQGIRALAVGSVLVDPFRPTGAACGFIGVDGLLCSLQAS
jgi:peptidoglycan/LPS O-acetylase OafA/YrhL